MVLDMACCVISFDIAILTETEEIFLFDFVVKLRVTRGKHFKVVNRN